MSVVESRPPAAKVMIVDDHELFRDALAMLLEAQGHEIVGTASNGLHALDLVGELEPDVVLMDVRMPILDGIDATKRIKNIRPGIKVVMLSAFDDEDYVARAIKFGADGYILKDVPGEEFGALVAAVSNGERNLPNVKTSADPATAPVKDDGGSLSQREREVVRHVAAGGTNREISAELLISENTVRNHISSVLSKLKLRNRAEIAAYAVRMKLTPSD